MYWSKATGLALAFVLLLSALGLALAQAEDDMPPWQQLPFVDARTGEEWTLADFAGKTVVVETFATWCTNCRRQLREVATVYAKLDPEQVVYLTLGVDPSDDTAKIARYAEDNGFAWSFGLSSRELTTALIERFGRTITNVSSVPMFILRSDRTVSELFLGFHSGEDLLKLIAEEEAKSAGPVATPTPQPTAVDRPAWQQIPFADARTGEMIAFADFAGKTVVVETMAVWCSNCRRQLTYVNEALPRLDPDEVVYIALGIDPAEDAAKLARFANEQGYTWLFGISSPELTAALIAQFGRAVTSPPSVPLFIITPDGTASGLFLGFHRPDELIQLIADHS